MLELEINGLVEDVYEEIVTLPFYQDGDVYKYSTHLLVGESANSKYMEFLERDTRSFPFETVSYIDYLEFFNESIDQLNEITIPRKEYDRWLFDQKKSESIEEYNNLVYEIHGELNRLCYTETLGDFYPHEVESQAFDTVLSYGGFKSGILVDLDKPFDDGKVYEGASPGHRVLNRNNPFADVSIEDQKFLYATETGSFNVLELNTSHTLTRIQKDDKKSYLALQPGFKIRVSSDLEGGQTSDIVFDDTLTTKIAQDDKVYVYL